MVIHDVHARCDILLGTSFDLGSSEVPGRWLELGVAQHRTCTRSKAVARMWTLFASERFSLARHFPVVCTVFTLS